MSLLLIYYIDMFILVNNYGYNSMHKLFWNWNWFLKYYSLVVKVYFKGYISL